jgi:chemotaxis protein histidine kinase CheA
MNTPKRRNNAPSVATFADHEVITPPHGLRKAVAAATEGDEDPIARAEAALAELAGEFNDWMHSECERLETARRQLREAGVSKETYDALFRAAHDIKGEAATFGFPTIGTVAESLCLLIEQTDGMRMPLSLVDKHVDAIRAIVREGSAADVGGLAGALARRLREVTDAFLLSQSTTRQDDLRSIHGPPLSPARDG